MCCWDGCLLSRLQLTFGGGQIEVVNVTTRSHFNRSGKTFEDRFYLVMLICSLCLYVKVHQCAVAKTFEEMIKALNSVGLVNIVGFATSTPT